jgi:hypothetical protein
VKIIINLTEPAVDHRNQYHALQQSGKAAAVAVNTYNNRAACAAIAGDGTGCTQQWPCHVI